MRPLREKNTSEKTPVVVKSHVDIRPVAVTQLPDTNWCASHFFAQIAWLEESHRMLKKLLLAAVVLSLQQVEVFAQSPNHLQDLRDWQTLGLPMAAEWNTHGFTLQYHVDQVRQGHRFLPSVLVPASSTRANAAPFVAASLKLDDNGWAYLRSNNLPICLRTQNIANAFTEPLYRLPKIASSIPNSALVWFKTATGALEDAKLTDIFGPTSIWASEGDLLAKSALLQKLQENHPSPAFLVFLENNEGATEKLVRYATVDTKVRNAYGLPTLRWLPAEKLPGLSLRMSERVAALRKANPNTLADDFLPEFWNRRATRY
jgi:hypothetical protein